MKKPRTLVQQWRDGDFWEGAIQGTFIAIFLFIAFAPLSARADATLISSGSLSSTVVTIANIPQTYAALQLSVFGASSDTATRGVNLLVSDDNGASCENTNYETVWLQSDLTGGAYTDNLIGTDEGATAANTHDISVNIVGYQTGISTQSTTVYLYGASRYSSWAMYKPTAAINALCIGWSGSGSFDAGTYALYGLGTATSTSGGGSSSTSTTSVLSTIQDSNRDFFFGVMLFFTVFFGIIWLFRRPRV